MNLNEGGQGLGDHCKGGMGLRRGWKSGRGGVWSTKKVKEGKKGEEWEELVEGERIW